MTSDPMASETMRGEIRAKVIELAREIGRDAKSLTADRSIPDTGYLDSPGIMALIAWFEVRFGLDIEQEDLTLENFGTIDAMVEYAVSHG